MKRFSFITDPLQKYHIDIEDGGQAKIATLDGPENPNRKDSGVFVRFQSWCEADHHIDIDKQKLEHPIFDALIKKGKRYRVTITQLKD